MGLGLPRLVAKVARVAPVAKLLRLPMVLPLPCLIAKGGHGCLLLLWLPMVLPLPCLVGVQCCVRRAVKHLEQAGETGLIPASQSGAVGSGAVTNGHGN